jgi:hypothetical protein
MKPRQRRLNLPGLALAARSDPPACMPRAPRSPWRPLSPWVGSLPLLRQCGVLGACRPLCLAVAV